MSAPKRFASLPRIFVTGIAIALLALSASAPWAPPAHATIEELLIREVQAQGRTTEVVLSWLPPLAPTSGSYDHDNDPDTPAIEYSAYATVAHYEFRFEFREPQLIVPSSDRNARVETTVTGLQPGMQYAFTIRTCSTDSTCGPVERHRYVWTAPAPPIAFQVGNVTSHGTADLFWLSSYSEDIPRPGNFDRFTCAFTVDTSPRSFTNCPDYNDTRRTTARVTGLNPSEQYLFRVRHAGFSYTTGRGPTGTDPLGNLLTGSMVQSSPAEVILEGRPSVPTNFRATPDRDSVTLNWNAVTQTDTGRPVTVIGYLTSYYRVEDDPQDAVTKWGPQVSGTTATISGLQSGTAYKFAVHAIAKHRRSLSTGWLDATTLDFQTSLQLSGPVLANYDTNGDGTVDSEEIVAAIEDFDLGLMTQEQFYDLLREYFDQ
ncbi:MAG: hypothetical protein F4X57_00090 [Chloroflexi bacterium]|nr:hypothetical protein [Chloroflexota bacterium]